MSAASPTTSAASRTTSAASRTTSAASRTTSAALETMSRSLRRVQWVAAALSATLLSCLLPGALLASSAFGPSGSSEASESAARPSGYRWTRLLEGSGFQPLSHPEDATLPTRAWIRRAPATLDRALNPGNPGGPAARAPPFTDHSPQAAGAATLLIVLESDGAAWRAGGHLPPADPTPVEPLGLQIAQAAPGSWDVVYFARPCQFLDPHQRQSGRCGNPGWWTTKRFSDPVVQHYIERIRDLLVAQGVASRPEGEIPPAREQQRLILTGFSGGGTLAMLLAAHWPRYVHDPASVCVATLASPLDLATWTAHHRLSPMNDLASPANDPARLRRALERVHARFFFGARDRIVPPLSAGHFATDPDWQSSIHILPNLSHNNAWLGVWPSILRKVC